MVKKIIPFNVAIKSTATRRSYDIPKAYTNDLNSVEFQFTITDMTAEDLATATANVLLYMRDGSFFQNNAASGVTIVGNVVKYTLKENEGNHSGIGETQVEIFYDEVIDKKLASQKYEFEIVSGLETEVAVEVMIQDWTTLTAEARTFIDNSTIEVGALKTELQTAIETANTSLGEFDVALQNGIVAANLAEKLEDFESTNNSRLLSAERQLEQKPNLADLPSSAYTFKGSTTFAALPTTGNTLGDTYYVTDGTPQNYAWTGTVWTPIGNGAFADGTVVTKKIATGAVTPKVTSFFDIYDISFEFIDGFIIQNAGVEQVNGDYYITNYIPVSALSPYAINFTTSVHFYDANKVWISWGGVITSASFTTVANTAFVRFTRLISAKPTSPVLVPGTVVKNASDVIPKVKLDNLPKLSAFTNDVGFISDIPEITPVDTTFFDGQLNIDFEIIEGKIIQPGGVEQVNVDWWISNFITVTEGYHAINFEATIHVYNSSDVWLTSLGTVNNGAFLIPTGGAKIKFTKQISLLPVDRATMMLVEGNVVKTPDECAPKVSAKNINAFGINDIIKYICWFNGKVVTFVGDSITHQNYFEPYLKSRLLLASYYKQGIGGSTITKNNKFANVSADGLTVYSIDVPSDYVPASGIVIPAEMSSQERINLIPLNSQAVFIMGATNDCGQNIAMGTFEPPYLATTFCGALMLMISRVRARVPNAQIFICSPIYGNNPGGNTNLTAPFKNTLGFTIMDYGKKIKEACEISSVNYVPVGETSGIAYYNIVENLEDGVHPQQATGAKKIANAIYNSVKDYEPIA